MSFSGGQVLKVVKVLLSRRLARCEVLPLMVEEVDPIARDLRRVNDVS